MVRFLVSILLGAAVTFALFTFMAFLVSSSDRSKDEVLKEILVEVNTTPPASKAQGRRQPPPPPPPPPQTPPKVAVPDPVVNDVTSGMNVNMPAVVLTGGDSGLKGPGLGMNQDGDATPIVRIEPKYPVKASREGITGWVKLSFTINKLGAVEDVTVLEAQPRRIFDKEAKRALRKWKYKPKLLDGKPLRQPGLTVQLDFKMDES
jgi:protein TonB